MDICFRIKEVLAWNIPSYTLFLSRPLQAFIENRTLALSQPSRSEDEEGTT